ncbi:MAG: hypothetical protein AAF709_14795, partial [Pseudomonadota bacterium]
MAIPGTKSQNDFAPSKIDTGTSSNVITFPITAHRPSIQTERPKLSASEFQVIETLRRFAIESQLCARSKLVHTCAIVQPIPDRELRETALIFLGVMSEFANKRVTFFSPGTPEVSDTERWIIRLINAFADGETQAGRALTSLKELPIILDSGKTVFLNDVA